MVSYNSYVFCYNYCHYFVIYFSLTITLSIFSCHHCRWSTSSSTTCNTSFTIILFVSFHNSIFPLYLLPLFLLYCVIHLLLSDFYLFLSYNLHSPLIPTTILLLFSTLVPKSLTRWHKQSHPDTSVTVRVHCTWGIYSVLLILFVSDPSVHSILNKSQKISSLLYELYPIFFHISIFLFQIEPCDNKVIHSPSFTNNTRNSTSKYVCTSYCH